MSPSSTFSAVASHAINHKRWRLAVWGHGDEAIAMAARAAYIDWPVRENATTNMRRRTSQLQFFCGSARGPGPKPISDEICKVHNIYHGDANGNG